MSPAAPSPLPRIGLALGSGSARGWAHIGVLRTLMSIGLQPSVVCGSSIGALVGAAHAIGTLPQLEALARELTRRDLVRLLDVRLTAGGLVGGDRLMRLLEQILGDATIEALPIAFAATATDIHTGQEIWLETGRLADAVRASIALPGVLRPAARGEQHLVDGGLVNPVPVSLCQAMGADVVIAVNLNSNRIGRRTTRKQRKAKARTELFERLSADMPRPLRSQANRLAAQFLGEPSKGVEFWDVLISALNIMQEEVTRGRLHQNRPDILVEPRLHQIGLLEFFRAAEAIEAGAEAMRDAAASLAAKGIAGAPPPQPRAATTTDDMDAPRPA